MFGEQVTIGQAGIVCIFSIIVVFLVLLAISYLIDLTAYVVRRAERAKTSAAGGKAAVSVPAPESDAHAGQDRSDLQEALEKKKLILASAAIAAFYAGTGKEAVIRRITPVFGDDTEWSRAGRTGVRKLN